jgi:hypothetical protein
MGHPTLKFQVEGPPGAALKQGRAVRVWNGMAYKGWGDQRQGTDLRSPQLTPGLAAATELIPRMANAHSVGATGTSAP